MLALPIATTIANPAAFHADAWLSEAALPYPDRHWRLVSSDNSRYDGSISYPQSSCGPFPSHVGWRAPTPLAILNQRFLGDDESLPEYRSASRHAIVVVVRGDAGAHFDPGAR